MSCVHQHFRWAWSTPNEQMHNFDEHGFYRCLGDAGWDGAHSDSSPRVPGSDRKHRCFCQETGRESGELVGVSYTGRGGTGSTIHSVFLHSPSVLRILPHDWSMWGVVACCARGVNAHIRRLSLCSRCKGVGVDSGLLGEVVEREGG